MRQFFLVPATVAALFASLSAVAQDHASMNHQMHMPGGAADQRQLVDFPPAMREHTLTTMRDHLQALSEILTAMSGAQYAQAARIATTRLGMDSPSAEGCQSETAASTAMISKPANMDRQMTQFMPEGMRGIGLEMHQAASAFAREATKASKSGSGKAALTALSRVTQQCASCHATYKLQ